MYFILFYCKPLKQALILNLLVFVSMSNNKRSKTGKESLKPQQLESEQSDSLSFHSSESAQNKHGSERH